MSHALQTVTALESEGYSQIECHCPGCGFWAETFADVRSRDLYPTIDNLNIKQLMLLMRCAFCPGRPQASAAKPWGQYDAGEAQTQVRAKKFG